MDFENGEPVGFEPFLAGFLIEREDGGYGYLGRLAGLAVAQDGALYVGDDANGIIYRVTYAGTEAASSAGSQTPPDVVPEPPQSQIALDLIEPTGDAGLDGFGAVRAAVTDPAEHAADGDNASPAIDWSDAPEGTQSYVLIVDDPDAAAPKPFTHWIAYDLPADLTSLREGLPTEPVLADIEGAKQGTNSRGSTGYFGPKPPVGDPAAQLPLPGLRTRRGGTRAAAGRHTRGGAQGDGRARARGGRDRRHLCSARSPKPPRSSSPSETVCDASAALRTARRQPSRASQPLIGGGRE